MNIICINPRNEELIACIYNACNILSCLGPANSYNNEDNVVFPIMLFIDIDYD